VGIRSAARGLELIEVARRATVTLTGTDLDDRALAAARANLDAAQVIATLERADARAATGSADLDLVITNPPLGSRVQVDAAALLVAMLPRDSRAARAGAGGSCGSRPPRRQTTPVAEAAHLRRGFWAPIDLGGVRGRLEHWTKA